MAYRTAEDIADRQEALSVRFHSGEFSADVYRASLFALGWRGADLDSIIRQEQEIAYDRSQSRRRPPV